MTYSKIIKILKLLIEIEDIEIIKYSLESLIEDLEENNKKSSE